MIYIVTEIATGNEVSRYAAAQPVITRATQIETDLPTEPTEE